MRNGQLIVFEGADTVGKTSLSSEAVNFLRTNGVDCESFSFPGKDKNTLGGLVYEVHHSPEHFGLEGLLPASLQTLHIAAHIDAIEKRILPAIRGGKWIVLDRFWWSTWVYGLNAGVEPRYLELMIELEKLHWAEVVPSVLFLVKRPAPNGLQRAESTLEKLNKLYDYLAAQECDRYPVQIIHNGNLAESIGRVTSAIKGLHTIQS